MQPGCDGQQGACKGCSSSVFQEASRQGTAGKRKMCSVASRVEYAGCLPPPRTRPPLSQGDSEGKAGSFPAAGEQLSSPGQKALRQPRLQPQHLLKQSLICQMQPEINVPLTTVQCILAFMLLVHLATLVHAVARGEEQG